MEIRIMTQSPHSEILNCLTTRPLGVPFSSILPTCALEGLAEKLQVAQLELSGPQNLYLKKLPPCSHFSEFPWVLSIQLQADRNHNTPSGFSDYSTPQATRKHWVGMQLLSSQLHLFPVLKDISRPGMAAHACNAHSSGKGRRTECLRPAWATQWVSGQPGIQSNFHLSHSPHHTYKGNENT